MGMRRLVSLSSSHQRSMQLHAHLWQLLPSLALLLLLACQCSEGQALPQFSSEWHGWKLEHRKEYKTEREEMYRHVVWQSNKKFIETHNLYNASFGYTLAMNEMGDLVGIQDRHDKLEY